MGVDIAHGNGPDRFKPDPVAALRNKLGHLHRGEVGKMFMGTSAGEKRMHIPDVLPLDFLDLLLRFRDTLNLLRMRGLYFANGRAEEGLAEYSEQEDLRSRTKQQRRLLNLLIPSCLLLDPKELALGGLLPNAATGPDDYTRWQNDQIRSLDESLPQDFRLVKAGWYHTHPRGGSPQGGEVVPDQELLELMPGVIVPIYFPPGYNLEGEQRAPYLAKADDRDRRLHIPRTTEEIRDELSKLHKNPINPQVAANIAAMYRGLIFNKPIPLAKPAEPLKDALKGQVSRTRRRVLRVFEYLNKERIISGKIPEDLLQELHPHSR